MAVAVSHAPVVVELSDSRTATPQQEHALCHPVADVPPNNGDFFDPTVPGADEFLRDPYTSASQIFAIMRQWVPHTQKNMTALIEELLRRGCHVDDRDALTDTTMLHFACKSAASGVGDVQAASTLVTHLISQGVDVNAQCRWTGMVALHYVAYFDAGPLVDVVMETRKVDVNVQCVVQFSGGTPLHVAAANFALQAVERLLQHGGNPWIVNSDGQTALDCVPASDSELATVLRCIGQDDVADKLRHVLQQAMEKTPKPDDFDGSASVSSPAKREVRLGDRVLVSGRRYGKARYIGRVSFTPASLGCSRYPQAAANQTWVGVELEQATGENNGCVDSKEYFSCPPRKGTFALIDDVAVAKYASAQAAKEAATATPSVSRSGGSSVGSRSLRKNTTNSSIASAAASTTTTGPSSSLLSARKSSATLSPPSPASPATVSPSKRNRRISASDAREMRSLAKVGASHPDGGGTRKSSTASDYKVGDLVLVSGTKAGVINFIGETEFAQGIWYGIKLDQAEGKNDGSVAGQRYFTCKANHGLFAPLSKLNHKSSTTAFSSTSSRQRSVSSRSVAASTTSNSPAAPPSSSSSYSTDGTKAVDLMNCKVLVSGEMATVRFAGKVDFAEGVWLGLEMAKTSGKHDGSVKGRRYFSCKQDHGLMVRPQRATYRGLSCATLLGNQEPTNQ